MNNNYNKFKNVKLIYLQFSVIQENKINFEVKSLCLDVLNHLKVSA